MSAGIPSGLWPHFQEYDLQSLDIDRDADLVIQRTFLRGHGERMLSAATFNFWRKLLGVRRWRRSAFAAEAKQLWPF